MLCTRASRRNLLALALAAGLALAPLAPVEARRLEPRQNPTVEPRQPERARHDLWNALWSFLVAAWGKDGSHADPYG
jgi:hypothetical protein